MGVRPADLPALGPIDSSRFAWDVPGFLRRGRALGRAWGPDHHEGPAVGLWAFRLAGDRVVVLSDASALHRDELAYYRGEVLAPLLGPTSAIALDGEAHGPARAAVDKLVAACARVDVGEVVAAEVLADLRRAAPARAVRQFDAFDLLPRDLAAEARPFDAVPALRRAAALVAVRALQARRRLAAPRREVAEALLWLLRLAERPALVAPALRAVSPAWWLVAGARARLLEALGLTPGAAADAEVTFLVGAVTNPALVAARALTLRGSPTERYLASLRTAPVPLALRCAARPLELCGVSFGVGDAVAVDLGAAASPGGAGPHRCPGVGPSGPARRLAQLAASVADELGLACVAHDEGRVGLAWGVRRVILAPRG